MNVADLAVRLGIEAVEALLQALLAHPDPKPYLDAMTRKARADADAAILLRAKFG